jgi:hypothetical protein
MKDARVLALGTTQYPLVGRLAGWPELYLQVDRILQHIPFLRGQGNMLFAVLQKGGQ